MGGGGMRSIPLMSSSSSNGDLISGRPEALAPSTLSKKDLLWFSRSAPPMALSLASSMVGPGPKKSLKSASGRLWDGDGDCWKSASGLRDGGDWNDPEVLPAGILLSPEKDDLDDDDGGGRSLEARLEPPFLR
mmetsp:Transcript_35631/g.65524  ORF Transcript_35631/g.65524 Transcript_35631/m.65524 type:complete len:133 (+) Transcript_35631:127-525(+)